MSQLAQSHHDRYKHNVALAERVEAALPEDRDWSCVVRFYAAVHLVTAYLVVKSNVIFDPDATSHADRKKLMEACPEIHNKMKHEYRRLKDLSESVRYDAGFAYGDAHHSDAKACLQKIVSVVEPKFKKIATTS